jgi:hypothetical protein
MQNDYESIQSETLAIAPRPQDQGIGGVRAR